MIWKRRNSITNDNFTRQKHQNIEMVLQPILLIYIAILVGAETNEKKNFNLAIWELFSVLFDERINICMGLNRKFFYFGTEKTVFFCIIDDKKLLSIVKMRYATEISYNDIKNQVFESPIYFLLAFVWTKQKRALSLES